MLINATPTGTSGELRVLARSEHLMTGAGVLGQLLDDHGARRHVDAQGQCFGGEHHLHQSLHKTCFHCLFERRHHTCMMGGDAVLQR